MNWTTSPHSTVNVRNQSTTSSSDQKRNSLREMRKEARLAEAETPLLARSYFDERISAEEWRARTARLLSQGPFSADDIDQAGEAIRWWTTQVRSKNKVLQVEAVRNALKLFEQCHLELQADPALLEKVPYWYNGRTPRATHILNAVLDAWRISWCSTKKHRDLKSPENMLAFLKEMNEPPILSCRSYSIIMHAAVQKPVRRHESPLFCESVLSQMLERSQFDKAALPDKVALSTVLNAWAKSGRSDAPERADQLFVQILQLYEHRALDAMPDRILYNSMLVALVSTKSSKQMDLRRRKHWIERADEYLRDMQLSPYSRVSPNTTSFRIVIFAWADLSQHSFQAIDRAFQLLQEMVRLYEAGDPHVEPDAPLFAKLLSTLIRRGLGKRVAMDRYEKAEEIYQYMSELHKRTQDARFAPDIHIARAMCIVYAKTKRPHKADAMLELLEKLSEKHDDPELLPGLGHYCDVIAAFQEKKDEPGAAEAAEKVLLRMIYVATVQRRKKVLPNWSDADLVFKIWSEGRRDGKRAEALLRNLQKLYEETKFSQLKPKPAWFLRVMSAWTNSGSPDAGQRAEDLLSEMEGLVAGGDDDMRPNRFHYAVVVNALVNSSERNVVQRCTEVLKKAIKSYENGNTEARPDTPMYGAVFRATSRAGDGEKAMLLLHTMIEDYRRGNFSAKPTVGIFNMVLLSWLRSHREEAPERALEILRMMEDPHFTVSPNERTYRLLVEMFSKARSREMVERAKEFERNLATMQERPS
jgi:hypothetical protein